jgi:hypothetical protein
MLDRLPLGEIEPLLVDRPATFALQPGHCVPFP